MTAACEWCADEEKPIYRKTLCRSCYRISRKLHKAKVQYETRESLPELLRPRPESEFLRAKREMEIAKWEGATYGDIDRIPVDGMRLEMEFRFLSKRLLGKEMFFQSSNYAFDREFTMRQRRIILRFLARMTREYLRKRRRIIADNTAHMATGWQQFI